MKKPKSVMKRIPIELLEEMQQTKKYYNTTDNAAFKIIASDTKSVRQVKKLISDVSTIIKKT